MKGRGPIPGRYSVAIFLPRVELQSRLQMVGQGCRMATGKRLEITRPLWPIRQKLNRAPNWNWRGVLTVAVIGAKGDPESKLGTSGIPNCA